MTFRILQNTQWHRVLFTTLLTGGYIVMLRSGVRQGLFLTEADFLPPSDKSADDETDPIAEGTPEQTWPPGAGRCMTCASSAAS